MPAEVKYLLFLIIPAIQDVLIILLVIRGFRLKRKREEDIESFRVKGLISLTPSLLICGALCGAVLSIPLTLFGPEQMSAGVWYLFEAAVLACLAMLLAFCNETITYDESGFTASDLLGRKRTYGYEEISGISWKTGDVILHVGPQKVRIDAMARGGESLLACAEEAYHERFGCSVPVREPSKDPMRGNIKDPWLNLFLRVLTILVGGALLFVSVVMLSPADDSLPGNAEEIRTAFVSYEISEDALLLHVENDEKPYSLSGLSGYEVPLPEPDRLCSGEVFSVFICEEKKQYEIYSIAADDGLPVISAYDRNQAVRSEQFLPGILELIFGVICVIYGVFGIIVGRHPERFPRWIRKFCYKDPVWSETAKRKYGL